MLCSPKIFKKRNFDEILTFLKKTWRIWRNRTYQKMGTFFTKILKIEIRKRKEYKMMKNQFKNITKSIETFKKTHCFSTRNDQFLFFRFFLWSCKKTRGLNQNPLKEQIHFVHERIRIDIKSFLVQETCWNFNFFEEILKNLKKSYLPKYGNFFHENFRNRN